MRAELPVISFLCVVLLITLAPLHWHSRNVAVLSIIIWLLICNIIQGINTSVWAENAVVRIPVWCDIVTKLLLGARIALSAASLRLCHSLRNSISVTETKGRRHAFTLDLIINVTLPVLYMALHAIVQTRRFDLAENLGCDASTYASVPAIILVWLPPLIFCIATFIYACFILFTWFKRHSLFNNHAIDTSRLSVFTILRPLLTASLIASIVLASTGFSMYARITTSGGLLPWTSLYQVHAQFSQVNVIPQSSRLYLAQLEFTWWAIPACSLVLIAMTLPGLASRERGKAALDGYHAFSQWFCRTILRQPAVHPFMQSKALQPSVANASASPVPIHLLKSGWDDTFRTSSSSKKLALTIPGGTPPATPPVSEDSFVQSTITYLESPTGREAHGLPPLLSVHQTPQTDPSRSLPAPINSALGSSSQNTSHNNIERPQSQDYRPHSILSSPWPRPPSTIPSGSPQTSISICPPSPVPLHYAHSRPPSISSLTTSLASSTISTFAYAHEPGLLSHDAHSMPHEAPFQSAPAVNGARGPGLAMPRHLRRVKGRDALLPRSLSPRGRVNGREKADDEMGGAIYMTVVQETV